VFKCSQRLWNWNNHLQHREGKKGRSRVTYLELERYSQKQKTHAAAPERLAVASSSARQASVAETQNTGSVLPKSHFFHNTHSFPVLYMLVFMEINTHAGKNFKCGVKIEWFYKNRNSMNIWGWSFLPWFWAT
jgi:hypothetical protein